MSPFACLRNKLVGLKFTSNISEARQCMEKRNPNISFSPPKRVKNFSSYLSKAHKTEQLDMVTATSAQEQCSTQPHHFENDPGAGPYREADEPTAQSSNEAASPGDPSPSREAGPNAIEPANEAGAHAGTHRRGDISESPIRDNTDEYFAEANADFSLIESPISATVQILSAISA